MGQWSCSSLRRKSSICHPFRRKCWGSQCPLPRSITSLQRFAALSACLNSFKALVHWTGLFHRAIAQSGTSLCPWASSEAVAKHSFYLAKKLGCLQKKSDAQLECVRTKKAEELVLSPEVGHVIDPRKHYSWWPQITTICGHVLVL